MRTNSRSAGLFLFSALLLILTQPRAHANVAEDTKVFGAFTIYVRAEISSPAVNAQFHTGSIMEQAMPINYGCGHTMRVTPDGTQTKNTTWSMVADLYLDNPNTDLNVIASGPPGNSRRFHDRDPVHPHYAKG